MCPSDDVHGASAARARGRKDAPGDAMMPPVSASPAHAQAAPLHVVASAAAPAEEELRRTLTTLLPQMRAFARFLAHDRAHADDLVQETLLRALSALRQFQPGTSLKAWVLTIQRNVFYEQARRGRREQHALAQRFAEDEAGGPPQDARTELSDLHRLLFTLPPLLREALVLVGAQGLSQEEAAAICGVPVGTMKARVSRGRAKLAQAAGRTPPGASDADEPPP